MAQRHIRRGQNSSFEGKCLVFYDRSRPTSLHVGASKLNGLGLLLKQLDVANVWRACGCARIIRKSRENLPEFANANYLTNLVKGN
jgi:hypothetical protein